MTNEFPSSGHFGSVGAGERARALGSDYVLVSVG